MSQITLRNLDPQIEREIRHIAEKEGKSLNRVVLDIISKVTGFQENKRMHPSESLKKLAGGWSKEEAASFYHSIQSCAQIDEEMWK